MELVAHVRQREADHEAVEAVERRDQPRERDQAVVRTAETALLDQRRHIDRPHTGRHGFPARQHRKTRAYHECTLARWPSKITVHDPRGYPPKVVGKRLANRLQSIDGKVVYLVDCLFDSSDIFMEQLRQWFAEHLPAVVTRVITPRESWVDDPDMRKKIAAEGNAAIIGVGL